MKVFVAGMGVISGIGNNLTENYQSLFEEKHGIGTITNIDTIHKSEVPVAEVKLSDYELIKQLNLTKGVFTRTTLLGLKAAKEAINMAGLENQDKTRFGFVSATTVAGMSKSEIYYQKYRDTDFKNEYINTHEAAVSTEKIAAFLGIKDFNTTISTACSSAANALMLAVRLIKHGKLDAVVAGGTDSLSKFTLNGFYTLKILDTQPCRPMDKSRKGLNLGEGAAYLVLVSEKFANENNLNILAEFAGYGNANDAFHQTASSPEGVGARMAMECAVKQANISPSEVDYINLHGTGTENNDITESKAVKKVFGDKIPALSSTKTYTGHTLAAAGALEAVFSVLAINRSVIFPNLRFETPIEPTGLIPVKHTINNTPVRAVLSNSFGFGGNCTSLIFKGL